MAELLQSARCKVARAKEHIAELQANTDHLFSGEPYRLVVESDPNDSRYQVYRLRFDDGILASIENPTSDALHNLRDSLDNSGYALAVPPEKPNPLSAGFPFARDAVDFKDSLGRPKDIPKNFRRSSEHTAHIGAVEPG